jgi:hypothetical protein
VKQVIFEVYLTLIPLPVMIYYSLTITPQRRWQMSSQQNRCAFCNKFEEEMSEATTVDGTTYCNQCAERFEELLDSDLYYVVVCAQEESFLILDILEAAEVDPEEQVFHVLADGQLHYAEGWVSMAEYVLGLV